MCTLWKLWVIHVGKVGELCARNLDNHAVFYWQMPILQYCNPLVLQFYPILSTILHPTSTSYLLYPIQSYPIPSYPIPSYPIQSNPIQSYPPQCNPILSNPILSYPTSYPTSYILSYILSYPTSYPTSYPIHLYQLLSNSQRYND